MASGDTKTEAMLNALGNGGSADEFRGCCNTKTQQYILDAIDRVQNVEDEVEELKNNPDVVDIVDTYADLQAYDKSTLTDKDIIRVLEDSTHSNKSTYYRYSASTDSFTYIGEAGGGVNVVQTPGAGQTDVMSQDATTSMVFSDPSTRNRVRIGNGSMTGNYSDSVAIGKNAQANGTECVVIGSGAGYGTALSAGSQLVAIGRSAGMNMSNAKGTVSLGAYSKATRIGEVNVGSTDTTYGYDSTNYRVIGGVHDPVDDHDVATKGYVDAHAGGSSIAYIKDTEFVEYGNATFYKDASFASAYNNGEIYDIMASGGDLTLLVKEVNESPSSSWRQIFRVVNGSYPTTRSDSAIEDTGITLCIYDCVNNKRYSFIGYDGLAVAANFTIS